MRMYVSQKSSSERSFENGPAVREAKNQGARSPSFGASEGARSNSAETSRLDVPRVARPKTKIRRKDSARPTTSRKTDEVYDWAPFVSVSLLIVALFSVVLCKMELRRMGYSVLKLTREERNMRDEQREQMIQLARMTRPERLQAVAQARLTLKKAESGQIIQMTQQGIALKQ